jgi:hypothetical protein
MNEWPGMVEMIHSSREVLHRPTKNNIASQFFLMQLNFLGDKASYIVPIDKKSFGKHIIMPNKKVIRVHLIQNDDNHP